MITEIASVTAVDGDYAWVQTQRQSACESCAAQKGCGTSVVAKVIGKQYTQVRVLNRLSARVGDTVQVSLSENMLLQGSLAAYLMPLLLMLGGGVLTDLWLPVPALGQWAAVVGSVAGLVAGAFWLRYYSRRVAKDVNFQPRIEQLLQSAPSNSISVYTP